jgi:hypothetical protein
MMRFDWNGNIEVSDTASTFFLKKVLDAFLFCFHMSFSGATRVRWMLRLSSLAHQELSMLAEIMRHKSLCHCVSTTYASTYPPRKESFWGQN